VNPTLRCPLTIPGSQPWRIWYRTPDAGHPVAMPSATDSGMMPGAKR
jgi:hypothetical protein